MSYRQRVRLLLLVLLTESVLAYALFQTKSLPYLLPGAQPARPAIKAPAAGPKSVVVDQFLFRSPASMKSWQEKAFRGKTKYELTREGEQTFLAGSSKAASSGLFLKMDTPVTPSLLLDWKWRVREFPRKPHPNKLAESRQDDFGARFYVIFAGASLFGSDVIEYLWDDSIPAGTISSSPFSGRVKLWVIQSSPAGEWKEESRNVYDDYRRAFGREPKRAIGAIAIMTDSDNTGTSSAADFGDVYLKKIVQEIKKV